MKTLICAVIVLFGCSIQAAIYQNPFTTDVIPVDGVVSNTLVISNGLTRLDLKTINTNGNATIRLGLGDNAGQTFSWQSVWSTNRWYMQSINTETDFGFMLTRLGTKIGRTGQTTTNAGVLVDGNGNRYVTNSTGIDGGGAGSGIPVLDGTGTNLSASSFTGTTNSPLIIRDTNGTPMVWIGTNSSSVRKMRLGSNELNSGFIAYDPSGGSRLILGISNSLEAISIIPNNGLFGWVGINTNNPGVALEVSGDGRFSDSVTAKSVSTVGTTGQGGSVSLSSSNGNGNAFTLQAGLIATNVTLLAPTNGWNGISPPFLLVVSNLVGDSNGTTGQLQVVAQSALGGSVPNGLVTNNGPAAVIISNNNSRIVINTNFLNIENLGSSVTNRISQTAFGATIETLGAGNVTNMIISLNTNGTVAIGTRTTTNQVVLSGGTVVSTAGHTAQGGNVTAENGNVVASGIIHFGSLSVAGAAMIEGTNTTTAANSLLLDARTGMTVDLVKVRHGGTNVFVVDTNGAALNFGGTYYPSNNVTAVNIWPE